MADSSFDFMSRSTALRAHGQKRTSFDPANPEHVESLKCFMETGSWGSVLFFPEFPYTEVPMTVLAKFAAHQLNVKRLSLAEKAIRAAEARKPLAEIAARNLEVGQLPSMNAKS